MNRFEFTALGVAAGAAVAGFLGTWKLVIAGVIVAVVSWTWRRYVAPRLFSL